MRRTASVIVAALMLLAAQWLLWPSTAWADDAIDQAEMLLDSGQAQRALALLLQSPEKDSARALELRARCMVDLGNLEEGRKLFGQAKLKAEQANDRTVLGLTHIGLGTIHRIEGELNKAQTSLKRGVGVLERSGNSKLAVPGYVRLAQVSIELKDYQSALSYLFIAEKILADDPANPARKDIYEGIVMLYEKQERTKDAIPYMEKVYRELVAEGDRAQARAWCYRTARAYESLKDYDKAIAFTDQELKLARELGDHKDLPGILVDLGVLSFKSDKRAQGRAYFEQALELVRRAGDKQKEADVLWQLADRYAAAQDFRRAVEIMQSCVEIEEQIGSPNLEQDRARLEKFKRMAEPQGETEQ